MYRFLASCCIFSLALFTPALVEAQKGGKMVNETGTPAEYGKLNQMKEVIGKVVSADAGGSTLRFAVEYVTYEPNNTKAPQQAKNIQPIRPQPLPRIQTPRVNNNVRRPGQRPGQNNNNNAQAIQQQIRMQQQMQQQMIQQQIRMQQQIMQQLAKAQQGNTGGANMKAVTHHKEFELPVSDKVLTRKMNLGQEYDDMGNLKTLSPAEVSKLKDSGLPGYKAEYKDLMPGQTVKMILASGSAPKGEVAKPTIKMVVILDANNDVGLPAGNGKKKN